MYQQLAHISLWHRYGALLDRLRVVVCCLAHALAFHLEKVDQVLSRLRCGALSLVQWRCFANSFVISDEMDACYTTAADSHK